MNSLPGVDAGKSTGGNSTTITPWSTSSETCACGRRATDAGSGAVTGVTSSKSDSGSACRAWKTRGGPTRSVRMAGGM